MPGLSTAFLPARLAQTAIPRGFFQPIAGRRFTRVATVLCQLVFQRLDPGGLERDDLEQAADQRNGGIFALTNSRSDLVFCWQAQGFHIPILTVFVDFDNGKVQQTFMSEQLQKLLA